MIKLYLTVAIILFAKCNSFAQDCYELQKKIGILFSKGDYQGALKIADSSASVCSKELGYESLGHIGSLNNLAAIYHQTGNYIKAETNYNLCLTLLKKGFGEANLNYATTLNSLAELYFKMNLYSTALPIQIKAIEIRKILLGEENIDYAASKKNLAKIYLRMGKYIEAENAFLQAQMIYRKVLGEENITYSKLLNDISVLYTDIGNYSKAILYQNQATEITKNLFGENDYEYAKYLRNLAQIYLTSGDYMKADEHNKRSLEIIKKQQKDNNEYVFNLNIIADQYNRMGKFAKAEELYLEALDIRKKSVGEEHLDYATSLSLLAGHYNKIGKYDKAESIFIKSLNITKRIVGEENMIYIRSLNNLAKIYNNLKDYSRSANIYNKVILLTKNILGDNNRDYSTYLNNLATTYIQLGKYEKAEPLLLKSNNIIKNILGETDFNYAISLNNLANLYDRLKKYSQAEKLYLESLIITKNSLGENHPNYANTLNNLAALYDNLGDYSKAEIFHIKAADLRKKYLGDEHPEYAESLSNLAYSYELNKKPNLSSSKYSSSIQITKNNWINNLSFLNSTEAEKYINSNEFIYESILSFLSRNPNDLVKLDLFDFSIFRKCILLNNSELLDKTIKNLYNNSIQSSWNNYKEIVFMINKQLNLSIESQKNISDLIQQKDSVEKQLLLSVPDFKVLLSNNQINWIDIKNKMKPHEVVLDFVHYRYHNVNWTDTIRYGVFILRKEWKQPRFINLFNEEKLVSLLKNSNDSGFINKLYFQKNNLSDSSFHSSLFKLIWEPIDSLLIGAEKVYISPSGLLNRVSFSAIPTNSGNRLIDRYSIEQLSNIRTISETAAFQEESISYMLLMGGINFDSEPTFSDNLSTNYWVSDTLFTDIRSINSAKWSYLSGTENEVSSLKKITAAMNVSSNTLTGSNASEEVIKKIGSDNKKVPSIIHLATHGFAFSTPKEINKEEILPWKNNSTNVYKLSTDPLTRVGLVMAGGNQVWSTGLPFPNREDGILTAREVSELNLKGCILATLSACETGLGEIKGSEGVFGLQRAFKMAGVKYIIASLWKVPDTQTKEFMELFYSAWLIQKLSIQDAFRQTQLIMSKKYSPYYWAAFTLVE
jgi:CHAT domain-containing protein/tetratricopeptide (TPR) repeat protein